MSFFKQFGKRKSSERQREFAESGLPQSSNEVAQSTSDSDIFSGMNLPDTVGPESSSFSFIQSGNEAYIDTSDEIKDSTQDENASICSSGSFESGFGFLNQESSTVERKRDSKKAKKRIKKARRPGQNRLVAEDTKPVVSSLVEHSTGEGAVVETVVSANVSSTAGSIPSVFAFFDDNKEDINVPCQSLAQVDGSERCQGQIDGQDCDSEDFQSDRSRNSNSAFTEDVIRDESSAGNFSQQLTSKYSLGSTSSSEEHLDEIGTSIHDTNTVINSTNTQLLSLLQDIPQKEEIYMESNLCNSSVNNIEELLDKNVSDENRDLLEDKYLDNHNRDCAGSDNDVDDTDNNNDDGDDSLTDDITSVETERKIHTQQDGNFKSENEVSIIHDVNYNPDLSADDRMQITLQDLDSQLIGLAEENDALRQSVLSILVEYKDAEKKHVEKKSELAELTIQESNAAMDEMYDLADELSQRIEDLKAEIKNEKLVGPLSRSEIQALIQERIALATKETDIRNECLIDLEKIQNEQKILSNILNSQLLDKLSKEKHSLNKLSDDIERATSHLELDQKHQAKNEHQLEEEIKERTADLRGEKDVVISDRRKIEDEIDELEKRLKELRLRKSQCDEKEDELNRKIIETEETFEPQKKQLQCQQEKITKEKEEIYKQKEKLQVLQEDYDITLRSHKETEERFLNMSKDMENRICSSKQRINDLLKRDQVCEECMEDISFTHDRDELLIRLEKEEAEMRLCLKVLSANVEEKHNLVTKMKKRVNEIEAQLPELVEAKTRAAKERNFKEAKRFAEHIKALTEEGKQSQENVELTQKDLLNDSKELEIMRKSLDELHTKVMEKCYEEDAKLFSLSREITCKLELYLERCEDDDLLVDLLSVEQRSWKNLAQELCQKHGFEMEEEQTIAVISDIQNATAEPEVIDECVVKEESDITDTNSKDDEQAVRCLREKIDELETQLKYVVEEENFDRADEISTEIEHLTETLKTLQNV